MIKYLRISGRINRTELVTLSLILFSLELISYWFINKDSNEFTIVSIILFFIYLMQCAKRYHDLNKWGINGFVWWVIPIANIFYFFQLYLLKGTVGINKYGQPSDFRINTRTGTSALDKSKSFDSIDTKQDILNELPNKEYTSVISENDKNILWVASWNKKNGDYCEIGEEICTIEYKQSHRYPKEKVFSSKRGFLHIKNNKAKIAENIADELFEVVDNENLYNKPIFEDDIFNKCENLKWEKVGANNFYEKRLNGFICTISQNSERIFFTINNIEGYDCIVVNFPKKDFDIKRGDKFLILLDSDDVINLIFNQNSYQAYESSDDNLRKIQENKVRITLSDIQKLAQYKIINWKLSFQTGQEITGIRPYGSIYHAYKSFDRVQDMVKLLAIDYLSELKNLKNYKPLSSYDSNNNTSKESCSLYLMIDTSNNFYKIGISNKPEYRERTLQSEKPTVELIISKEFPSRQIAESIEKALHYTYRDKNIRGEWFNLNQEDINDIKETLK